MKGVFKKFSTSYFYGDLTLGLLSSTVSITRFKVEGKIRDPILETVYDGLKKNPIAEINGDAADMAMGWTSFENPFNPDFEGSSFAYGSYMVFSLRVDKKTIPAKVLKKHLVMEFAKRLKETGRDYLSRNEKAEIRDHVVNVLNLRIPATPNVYDLIWNYEDSWVWFFTNQKSANEVLETLFAKSFKLTLIRLFPYTIADLAAGLSDADRDALNRLAPTSFQE